MGVVIWIAGEFALGSNAADHAHDGPESLVEELAKPAAR
jgi:hypothetical protein